MQEKLKLFFELIDRQPTQVKSRLVGHLYSYFCNSEDKKPHARFLCDAAPPEPFAPVEVIPTYDEEWGALVATINKSRPIEALRELIKIIGVVDHLINQFPLIDRYDLKSLADKGGSELLQSAALRMPLAAKMDERFVTEWLDVRKRDLSPEELSKTEASLL